MPSHASPYVRPGRGRVPATPLAAAAWKEAWDGPAAAAVKCLVPGLGTQLDFSLRGITSAQLKAFFDEALKAADKVEAIVEAGNKYSVDAGFTQLNGELLLFEIQHSPMYKALSSADQKRADEFFRIMCLNKNLRNRNPLHPNPLDSAVIGNLLNFPKHIFGFPFASFATNGLEALSLLLFSYRSECKGACVLHVLEAGAEPSPDFAVCAARLGMPYRTVAAADLGAEGKDAVVLCGLHHPDLGKVAAWAEQARGLHIHVSDAELRAVLASDEPVHFQLPQGVRSMSLEEGFFRSSFALYRDSNLRALHFDLPYIWQSQYVSPNEGGSGNTTPLYIDFCFLLLGWSAMRDACKAPSHRVSGPIPVRTLPPVNHAPAPEGVFEAVMEQGKADMKLTREELERNVLTFQRQFAGGQQREVEAVVTAGGTRSINVAIESVLARARPLLGKVTPRLVTGNPHLAVERAERRFLFDVTRVHEGLETSILCPAKLKREVGDPAVVAVYTQTLSITDGIVDPLEEVLAVLEEENKKRQTTGACPITLINDCCLAFSVLLHNDGRNGARNLRVLDLTAHCVTPTIMTLDAHKHIGADKGISMAMGTKGTLSFLKRSHIGAAPSDGELVRAMADMRLVGFEGYHQKYKVLAAALTKATTAIEAAGMKLVHKRHRPVGSTAFGVEDPSGRVLKAMKKRGHAPSPLFGLDPNLPENCQSGFLLSATPHALREVKGQPALDIFVKDLCESYRHCAANPPKLAHLFHEASLPAVLLAGGNEDNWAFMQLREPGLGRDVCSAVFRSVYSAIMDCGVVCTDKNPAPIRDLGTRAAGLGAAALLAAFLAKKSGEKEDQKAKLQSKL